MKAALMAIATKLIGAYALSQSAIHTEAAVKRFLGGLAMVLVLSMLCGMMLGSVVIGAHVLLYVALTDLALLTPVAALSVTLAVALTLTAVAVTLTIVRGKVMFEMSGKMAASAAEPAPKAAATAAATAANDPSLDQKIGNIAEAFIDGLKRGSAHR